MTAVDPGTRIRHPLDVFHSTFNPDGTVVPAGRVPVADGLGRVAYMAAGVPWEYAKADGGLVGDGTTNDTAAFQAWVTHLCSAGIEGRFEPGTYLISGALQDTGAFNAQILLPTVSTSADQVTLRLRGPSRPPFAFHGSATPAPGGYAIIKSTLTGASGTAAFMSAGNGSPPTQNNIQVVLENLIFVATDNPTFTMLNLSCTQGGEIRNIQITTASAMAGAGVQPTHSNSYGIKLAQPYNSNYTYVDGLSVGYFYNGMLQGELVTARGLIFGLCPIALELGASIHASLIVDMHQSGCATGIKVTGVHRCDILQYDSEHYIGGAYASWQNPVYDLDDSGNNFYGHIRWFDVGATAPTPGSFTYDHVFNVNGGSHGLFEEIGSPSAGTLADPMTTRGDVIVRNASNVTARLGIGAAGKILSSDGTDVSWGNGPMTTAGDLIVGGTSGAPTRLAKGADSQVLTVDPTTHLLVWATASSGFSNPMTTKGDIIVGDTGGTAIRKAVGSDTQVLTADSASTGGVKWAAAGSGSGALVFLEGHTASSSATLDFTTFISSTYDDYQIEIVGILPATDATDLQWEVGTGGGPTYDTTTTHYSSQLWGVNNAGGTYGPVVSNPAIPVIARKVSSTTDYGGVQLSMRLQLPQSTTQRRNLSGLGQYVTNDGGLAVAAVSSMAQYQTLGTALTAIRFLFSSGNIASGTIRIYGLTKS